MRKNPSLQKALEELGTVLQQWLVALDNRERLERVYQRLKGLIEAARNAGAAELLAQAMRQEKPLSALLAGPPPSPRNALQTAEALKQLLTWGAQSAAPVQAAVNTSESAPLYLVTDNPLRGEDLAMQLRYFGHSVELLQNIEQVEMAIVRRVPAALIIDLDYREDLLARIARFAHHPWPIALISTRGTFAARLAAARAGIDCYFTRPLDVGTLTDRLDALIFSKEVHPYRVLIVADKQEAAQQYKNLLNEARMDVSILDKFYLIFEALDEYRPELVVIDVDTPECNAIDLTRLIRQNTAYLDVPIMLLSSDGSLAHRLSAFHFGADGFLDKPFAPAHFVSLAASRTERYRALRGLIMRDSLTGLLNHSAVKETLVREMAISEREGVQLSLAMIDIDFFKRINDSYGHPVGDQVLRTLSRLLQQRLRRGDIVGRYGGEEFIVILPSTSVDAAFSVLDSIRDVFSRVRHHADERDFTVTFSAGVADITQHDTADALLRVADEALYTAKHNGRNRVQMG